MFRSIFFIVLFISLVACSNEPKTIQTHSEKNSTIVSKEEPSSDLEQKDEEAEDKDTTGKENEDIKLPTYSINSTTFRIESDEEKEFPIALLTFDDAPRNPEVVFSLLDTLDTYSAKSIWFVNGIQLVDSNGEIDEMKSKLLLEIKNRGHLIGNHTYDHKNMKNLTREQVKEDLEKTNKIIFEITGEYPEFFRHPFGSYNDTSVEVVDDLDMQHMNWSVGSLDWEYKDPNKIVEQTLSTMHDGANILFHDLPQTADALDSILKQLKKENYEFVLPL